MAKFYGNSVKTGKLGGSVFAIRNGETIERQYQPIVANPSTTAQVEARAKLKMLSQLSAVMGSIIAIPRKGAVSSRNLFVKLNYVKTSFSEGVATIPLEDIDLTNGILALPSLTATAGSNNVSASLSLAAPNINRVVYCLFRKLNDELFFVTSAVTTEGGASNRFETTLNTGFTATAANLVLYAYGIRDNNDRARGVFGNLQTPTASNVAQLISSRVITLSDISLTETQSVLINAAQTQNAPAINDDDNRSVKSKK